MLGGRRDSVGSISGRRDSVGSMLPRASDGASGGVKPRMRVAAGVGGASSRTPLLLPNARDFNAAGQRSSSGCRLYGRMALCFVGSMLSSGVLVSFPTLEPILLDQREGVVRTLVTRRLRCCEHLSLASCGAARRAVPHTRNVAGARRAPLCLRHTASRAGQTGLDRCRRSTAAPTQSTRALSSCNSRGRCTQSP